MVKGIVVLATYIFISLISVYLVYTDEVKYNNLKSKNKISLFTILIISLLFTFFNIFSTNISLEYGSDRIIYAYEFTGVRSSGSVALDFLFKIFREFGGNIKIFFYFTTFVCVFLTLLAYRISKKTNYKVFILLLTSEWILFTITALKQTYACVFSCFFFIFLIEYDNKKYGTIFSVIFAIIASMFHITGLILFPLFILVKMKKITEKKLMILLLLIILSIFLLKPISLFFKEIVGIFFPAYEIKINSYFTRETNILEVSSFSFIKYLPIYYIAILGIIKKKYILDIENYDHYLIISVLGAGLVGYTVVSYWFYRFNGIFYFPMFIFYKLLNSKIKNILEHNCNNIIVYGGSLVILMRKIILIFINYGQF